MNISELIERLEELQEIHGEECEVRLMTQEQWPFENKIYGVCDQLDIDRAREEDEDEDAEPIAYIVEGRQIRYGDKAAWDACN